MTALADGQPPRSVTVASVQPATQPPLPVTRDTEAGCDWLFRDYSAVPPDDARPIVTAFGRVSNLPESNFSVYFGIVGTSAILIGGAPVALNPADRASVADRVRPLLPATWPRNRVLVHAYRYQRAGGHQAIEVYAGLPVVNGTGAVPPIARISIQRHFLIDDRVAGFDSYERVSGQEERVDTEPPQLTDDNWSRSETERTVAFVSRDRGRSWERLSINVGFEGVHWIVQALRPGTPVVFHRYLYTTH